MQWYLFYILHLYKNTTIKSFPTLLFPYSLHGVSKVSILRIRTKMLRSILTHMKCTKTFSLVLAISKGLQTVTEITPASNPEMKLDSWAFTCPLLLEWSSFILDFVISIYKIIIIHYKQCTTLSIWVLVWPFLPE